MQFLQIVGFILLLAVASCLPCKFYEESVIISEGVNRRPTKRRCIKGKITRKVLENEAFGLCSAGRTRNCFFSQELLYVDVLKKGAEVVKTIAKNGAEISFDEEADNYVVALTKPSGGEDVGFEEVYKFRFCIKGRLGDAETYELISPGPGAISAYAPCALLYMED